MKTKPSLTAALLAALAMPALARDVPPKEQAPVDPAIDAVDAVPANQQAGQGAAQGRIVIQGDAPGRVVVRINGEEVELDGQEMDFEFELPEMVQPFAQAPEPIEATFLGVATEPLTQQAAQAAGLEHATGLALSFVQEGSPAAKAGLQAGDVLLKLDDQILINSEQLVVLIRSFEAGDKVTLHGLRAGEPINAEVTLDKAMVQPVGPGGAALDQPGWRVQQNGPMGENGGVMILPGGLIDQIGPIEGVPAELEELIRNLQQNQDQNMEQLLRQLDLDLGELQGEALGGAAMQTQVTQDDGEHAITLKTSGDANHLTIKDNAGEVLYDGVLPEDNIEQHLLEDQGLPLDVVEKVQPMLNDEMFEFKLDLKALPQGEQAPEAPDAPQPG